MLRNWMVLPVMLVFLQAQAGDLKVHVTLVPSVGNFVGTSSEVQGFVQKKNGEYVASNIKVPLKSLSTGVALRDEHTQKHLDVAQHPEAVLVEASGRDGKGRGILRLKGVEKEITGTFKVSADGKFLTASFPLLLSDFGISGIRFKGVGVKDGVNIDVMVPIK